MYIVPKNTKHNNTHCKKKKKCVENVQIIFRISYSTIFCAFTMQRVCLASERKLVALNFEDEINRCGEEKKKTSLRWSNRSIFSIDRRPRCRNYAHQNSVFLCFSFRVSTRPRCGPVSVNIVSFIVLSLLITFRLLAKGQWSRISKSSTNEQKNASQNN